MPNGRDPDAVLPDLALDNAKAKSLLLPGAQCHDPERPVKKLELLSAARRTARRLVIRWAGATRLGLEAIGSSQRRQRFAPAVSRLESRGGP